MFLTKKVHFVRQITLGLNHSCILDFCKQKLAASPLGPMSHLVRTVLTKTKSKLTPRKGQTLNLQCLKSEF